MPFDDLGLNARLLDAVRDLGYDEPTHIQRDRSAGTGAVGTGRESPSE